MDLNAFFKNNYFNTRKKKNLAQKKKKRFDVWFQYVNLQAKRNTQICCWVHAAFKVKSLTLKAWLSG